MKIGNIINFVKASNGIEARNQDLTADGSAPSSPSSPTSPNSTRR